MSGLPARVLVTGGGTGIGRAISTGLIQQGVEVIICGRRKDILQETARAIGATPVVADITNDPTSLVETVGPFDGLVHNAGCHVHQPIGEWTPHDWQQMWDVHVSGPAMLSQAFAKQCTGPGAIVAISSTLAVKTTAGAAAYSAAKAGMLSLIRSLSVELAEKRIRANAVLPGLVPTEMTRTPRGNQTTEEWQKILTGLHPLGRLGTPNEVAQAVILLLENAWITGSALTVDGGLLIGEQS